MIKAPYNFVPLNEKVFFPPWANQVSHDIPFSDGESGEIEIKITAKSSIFISDGKDKEKFCNHNGTYYIPGSSVKGMIRNVLEIMSFSKMKFVDDKTYAVRDLRNPDLYSNHFSINQIYCGWLRKVDNKYIVEDCGMPGWIKHEDVNAIVNMDFASKFSSGNFSNNVQYKKSAKYKYSLVSSSLGASFDFIEEDRYGKKIYKKGNSRKGRLVFTGQASARHNDGRQRNGKVHEFIFFEHENPSYYIVAPEVIENFKFAYFHERKTQPLESDDWTYWKNKLNNSEKVPVFFQKSNQNEVKHFGLSFLYKLPYNHSIHDGIYTIHKDILIRPDLTETIFGYTDKASSSSLKGRVNFSHATCEEASVSEVKKTVILGTPRASYYPIYIKQQNGQDYSTLMDENAVIAGRKRYPVHKNEPSDDNVDENKKMSTSFYPLNKDNVFDGKIRFHNFKKEELGALFSALTFHLNNQCFHTIGLAKSLGYGKIKIDIEKIKFSNKIIETNKIENTVKSYLIEYEKSLATQINNWHTTSELKELFTMATEQNNNGTSSLEYIETPQAYSQAKTTQGNIRYLKNYSMLQSIVANKPEKFFSGHVNSINFREHQDKQKEKDFKFIENCNRVDLCRLFIEKYNNSNEAEIITEKLNTLICNTVENSDIDALKEKIIIQKKNEQKKQKINMILDIEAYHKRVENEVNGQARGIRRAHNAINLQQAMSSLSIEELRGVAEDLNINIDDNRQIPATDILAITKKVLYNQDYIYLHRLADKIDKTSQEILDFCERESIEIEEPLTRNTMQMIEEYI